MILAKAFYFLPVAKTKTADFWNSLAGPLCDVGSVDLFLNPKITNTCIYCKR